MRTRLANLPSIKLINNNEVAPFVTAGPDCPEPIPQNRHGITKYLRMNN